MADNLEQFFTDTSPSTLPVDPSYTGDVDSIEQFFQPKSSQDSIEQFFQPESSQDTTQVVPTTDNSNRNSFMNLLLYGKDNVERNIYRSLDLFSDDLIKADSDLGNQLKNFSLDGIQRNEEQIKTRPIPDANLSFIDSYKRIREDISDGEYWDALVDGATTLKNNTAQGIGSTIPMFGPGLATAVAAPFVGISGVPLATLTFLSTLIPSSLAQKAGVYDEAKALGASEEKAREYSNYGGLAMGLMDRLVPAVVIKGLFNKVGKPAGLKIIESKIKVEVADKLGKEATEEVVEKTAKEIAAEAAKSVEKKWISPTVSEYVIKKKFITPSVLSTALKESSKIGLGESATEAAQEGLQIATAGLAADKGITPYQLPIIRDRLIEAGAAGWTTGRVIGLGSGTLKGMMDVNVVATANAKQDALEKAIPAIQAFPDSLVDPLSAEGRKDSNLSAIDVFFRRALSPLKSFASKGDKEQQIYNMFNNYYNDVSAEVGTKGDRIQEALRQVKRQIKLPLLQRSIAGGKNDAVFRYLSRGELSKDSRVNAAGKILREEVLGDIISDAIKIDAGVLESAIQNNLSTLPEIEKALAEGRIDTAKAQQLNKAFNNLKVKYTESFNQSNIDVTTGLEIDSEFTDQQKNMSLLAMQKESDYLSLANKEIAPLIATGFLNDFQKAGLDVSSRENYFPRVYKLGYRGQRRRAKKVLMKQQGMTEEEASKLIENARANGGLLVDPSQEVSLDPFEVKAVQDTKAGFEKQTKINQATFEALDDAGLVERNVAKVINKYNMEAVQRLKIKELADTVNTTFRQMRKENTLGDTEQKELQLMQDIFNAIQHRYNPMRSQGLKKAQKNFLTYQYMLTLPLSALTALTEPLIVLSRVGPKNAIFGAIQAARNTSRQAMRSIFPKISLSRAEEASRSILQLYDGTLAERLGDISGVDVNRKITDKFFRLIMLTQITQMSRDIAFQGGMRQSRQDMLDVLQGKASGKLSRGQVQAEKRLLEMGLVEQNFNTPEMVAWLEGPIGGKPPLIMRKALSKLVDEVIMAPNVVNRPLWMSNPNYAMIAQLKGFMFTFGNTVGMRMYREVFKPLAKGRIPAGEAVKYATAFTLIVAGSIGIKDMKDWWKNGDDDSAWKDAKGFSQILQAVLDSNLFGPGTVFADMLQAHKYGTAPVGILLGPGPQWLSNIIAAVGQFVGGSPRAIARFINNSFLPPSIVKKEFTEKMVKKVEDVIKPASKASEDLIEKLFN